MCSGANNHQLLYTSKYSSQRDRPAAVQLRCAALQISVSVNSLSALCQVQVANIVSFTTCIVCATRLHRQQFREACRSLQRQQCLRALDENIRNVETVQAFALMCHWKDRDVGRLRGTY